MCRYRYHYYAGCHHQRTVLVDYCADARTPAPQHPQPQQSQPPTPPHHSPAPAHREHDDEGGAGGSLPDSTSTSTAPSSSPATTLSPTTSHSHISHRQHPAAIIDSPTPGAASLPLQHDARRHSDGAVPGMAALSAYAQSHWIQPQQLIVGDANIGPADNSRLSADHRQESTYAQSVEPQLANSIESPHIRCHGYVGPTAATDDSQPPQHAHWSDRTNSDSKQSTVRQTYAKAYACLRHTEGQMEQVRIEHSLDEMSLQPRHGRNDHISSQPEGRDQAAAQLTIIQASPAALLRYEHSKLQQQQQEQDLSPDMTFPRGQRQVPTALDAPDLRPSSIPHTSAHRPDSRRQPTYVNMVFHSGAEAHQTDAGCQAQQQSASGTASIGQFQECLPPSARSILPEENAREPITILSPGSKGAGDEPASAVRPRPGSCNRSSPRFAQPTVSFSLRTEEINRRDPAGASAIKGSLSKTPSPCTGIQRQQKRKSLPGDWLSGSPVQTTKASDVSVRPAGSIHAQGGMLSTTQSREPLLRKPPSTYMSPTKAATQRTIAITGQDHNQVTSVRVQREATSIEASATPQKISADAYTRASSTASPDTTIQIEISTTPKSASLSEQERMAVTSVPRRSTIDGPAACPRQLPPTVSIAERLAQQAKAAGLPMVANLTAQRRGSHGHLLVPIKAKLDKIGILRDGPHVANVRRNSDLRGHVPESSASALYSPSTQDGLTGHGRPLHGNSNGQETDVSLSGKKVVVPPHVRAAMRDMQSDRITTLMHTDAVATAPALRATAQIFRPLKQMTEHTPQRRQSTPLQDITQAVLAPQALSQQAPSPQARLSAVAPALRPALEMHSHLAAPSTYSDFVTNQEAMRFYDDDEWFGMPVERRFAIRRRRSLLNGVPQIRNANVTGALPHHDIASAQGSVCSVPAALPTMCDINFPITRADQVLQGVSRIGELAQNVHVAGTLMPEADVAFHFGRAAAPLSVPPTFGIQSPSSSFSSSQSASPRTPESLPRSWTIGSDHIRRVYGWKGGDGREIKFIGHGPDAEREPDNGFRFSFQRRVTSMGRGPRLVGANGEDGSPEAPLAPRSRRQWAQLAGNTKQPCDKLEIVDAVEQMPFPDGQALYGYCNNCAISSH